MGRADTRIEWIDAARGLGIVLVVLGHAERGLVSAKIAQGSLWQWMDFGLYTFHMPLFFLLAGLNVPHALRRGAAGFLRGKAWTIAYPYLLWSVVQGLVLVALSASTNGRETLSDVLAIGWKPISQFWFLYVLMLCQLLAVPLAARPRLLTLAAVASLMASTLFARDSLPERFFYSLPYFAAGILLSPVCLRWRQIERADLPASSFALAFALGAFVLAVVATGEATRFNFVSLWVLPAAGFGIASIVLAARIVRGRILSLASALGAASMTIYVLHILFAAGTRIVMLKLGAPSNAWLFLAATVAAGVAGPFLVHRALARTNLLGWVGLAPFPARIGRAHDV